MKAVILKPNRGDDAFFPFLSQITECSQKNSELRELVDSFKGSYFSLYLLSQKENIENALNQNDFVILDRYLCSHLTYQMAFGELNSIFEPALYKIPQADYIFFLSVPIPLALDRIKNRGLPIQSYENETFLTKAQSIFYSMDVSFKKSLFIEKSGATPLEKLTLEFLEILCKKP